MPSLSDATLLDRVAAMDRALFPAPPVDTRALAHAAAALHAQPVVLTVVRFKCPFCPRSYSRRKAATTHIGRCWRNPAVAACKTCAHFARELPEPEVGLRGMEWCDAQDIELDGIRDHCPLWALRQPEAVAG